MKILKIRAWRRRHQLSKQMQMAPGPKILIFKSELRLNRFEVVESRFLRFSRTQMQIFLKEIQIFLTRLG